MTKRDDAVVVVGARKLLIFLYFATGGMCAVVLAEPAGPDGTSIVVQAGKKADTDPWAGFIPPEDDKFDWIQLVSGEWLKGEIRVMYNYVLEFDSDELDLLSLDWEDVRQIRSADLQSIYIETDEVGAEPITVVGQLVMVDDRVSVMFNGEQKVYRRSNIISIAEGSDAELDLWSGKLSYGANIRRGNSDLVDMNTNLSASRRTAETRYHISYVANLSRTQSSETSNNHRLITYYDIFSSNEVFWRPVFAEYYNDRFKNIKHQLSLGSGFGYHLIRTLKTELQISGGLGALYKHYESVTAGEDNENTSLLVVLGTMLETDITSIVEYKFDLNFKVVDRDSGQYIHHMISTLSTDLSSDLDLDISLVWDRIQRPQASDAGIVPKRDDVQLIVGISYEL